MKKGFTLIEMMVVVGLFTSLFGAILTVLTTADRSWRIGQNKLAEQQEARRAMDNITRLLRQSSPDWVIDETHYPVTITSEGTRIDFYQPIFNEQGEIFTLKKITIKLNPDDPHQLLKKEGTSSAIVIANDIEDVNIGGGCSGCSAFNCSTVANDCPMIKIEFKTKKQVEFTLASQVTLRNQNPILSDGVEIDEPEEGEF